MKRVIYITLLCLSVAISSHAQTIYKNQVRIENRSIVRSDDNRLTIAFDVYLQPNMEISSNRAATFTPILQTSANNKVMPAIIVYGRRRALVNERKNNVPKDAYTILRRKSKTEQKISYLVQFNYEGWMKQAELTMDIDLCGCGNHTEEQTQDQICQLNIEPVKLNPHIAYITPQAEAIKHRAASGSAFLDFPVNQTIIHPEYRNNGIELSKIRATIDTIRNDRNTSITSIKIEGFASPEGSYFTNARLAEGRTNSLMSYVRNYYQFDPKVLQTASTPEDWIGFRKFIEASNMDKKSEILAIMDSAEPNPDVKEKNIAKLIGPDAYRFLINECYPALRHSDYTVNYTVRGFTVEEAKDIINKHPQQLSLQEIFNLAHTYEMGSEEFNHAFQVAVLMFPEDPTANLNAAAMELQRGGNIAVAKKYLAKADQEAPATLNNLGVVAMLEGNFELAEQYFNKAKTNNASEPDSNMEELIKIRNFPRD